MSGDPREQPVIDPQTHVYARWLDAGTRLGFVVLLATFLAYVTGFFPAGTPIDDLPRFWTLPVEDYLKASGATTGWAWIWRLRYGDALTYFGVAIIAAVTMVCYLAILPVLVGISVGTNSGQSCVCMSRFIVPRARYDEITAKLTAAFQSLKVGDPHEPDTVISPLITKAHRDRVLELIRKGVAEGATIATGGRIPASPATGWYLEPTLLTNVRSDMTVAQEEFFGPVVVLIAHDGEDDAVRIANDSRYGLAGCVFTRDPVRGFEIARRIRTGVFSVNTFAADFNSPFGGFKQSGIGREHGPGAIEEYLLPRTITVSPDADFPPQVVAGVERVAPPF